MTSCSTATGRRLAAVLPVHVFGHPADGMALRLVADTWGLPLVERPLAVGVETLTAACLEVLARLRGNKMITTGGGGALVTDDAELARRARTCRLLPTTHPWAFVHDVVGWNDRLLISMLPWGWPSWRIWSSVCRPSAS